MNELTYNNYTFNEYTHLTVNASMVEDESQRTIPYHRYTIRAESTIYPENSETAAGQHFLRILQRLTKPGRKLTIDYPGFGPRLSVNDYGVFDVAFGPKPRVVAWDPVGDTNAVHVVWECEFCIPTCEGNQNVRFAGLMSLNFAINTRVNQSGYTSRTISGYIEIAMTRIQGLPAIPDTADGYRDVIVVAKPSNFQRETTWNLSLDKRRADFSIVDTEIESPNPYPPGVVRINANHRVGWSRNNMANLPNTIRASITLEPRHPRSKAWEIFKALLTSRMNVNGPLGVFLISLELDEEIYSNTLNFSATYLVFRNPSYPVTDDIFSGSGLGKPTDDSSWDPWSASVALAQSHRGYANLFHNPTQDHLVDLCETNVLPEAPLTYQPVIPPSTYTPYHNETPTPTKSYLKWETWIEVYEDNAATSQVEIGTDDLSDSTDVFDPIARLDSDSSEVEEIKRYIEESAADIKLVWKGHAIRAGHAIPRPRKLVIDGVTLVRRKSQFIQKFKGKFFGVKVFEAGWVHVYSVSKRPKTLPDSSMNSTEEFGGGE